VPDFPGLGDEFLSARDAEQLKNLFKNEGGQDSSNPSITDIDLESVISKQERMKWDLEKERRDIPKQIMAWAEKYNLGDEAWVKENFEFNNDGSVICNTNLYLDSMTEPDFPESIKLVNGHLFLNSLTSAKGLNLPKEIEGDLRLDGLSSAVGLDLPKEIGGALWLSSLTSSKGLELTDVNIKRHIVLGLMPRDEIEKLYKKYPTLNIVML